MSTSGKNKGKKRSVRQGRERLLAQIEDLDTTLEECSDDDVDQDVIGNSDHSLEVGHHNLPSSSATPTQRVILTNRRIEREKKSNEGRWFGGIRPLNPVYWLSNRWGNFRKTARSLQSTATAADRDVHSEPHRESPPPQLDTGGLSERSEGDYDPSQDTAPGSDPLTTSHPPKSEERMIHDHASGGAGGNSAANDARSAKKRNLKRKDREMSGKHARRFASSLEALSACDMKTNHSIADPHLRVELSIHGQYCGPMKRPAPVGRNMGCGARKRQRVDDGRDYFDEYCDSVFPGWHSCKDLAATLNDPSDNELAASMAAYSKASREDFLYDPFEFLANRAFDFARQDLVNALKSGLKTEANMTPDVLHLRAVPTYNRPILGCAGERKPDFVVMQVPPGAEVPSPVDARGAHAMIELKYDKVVQGQPPKLHDRESGIAVPSTYNGAANSQGSKCTPHEQIMEYNCFTLATQGPFRHHSFGLLVTWMRLQVMYADRAGCMISEERNFTNNFGLLFAALIGLYRSEAQRAGLQSTITALSGPEGTPLQPSDFDTSDRVVQTGAMINIGRPISPLQVLVKLASAPSKHVAVYAHGFNLMERPMAVDEEVAHSLYKSSSQRTPLRTRPSISRLAKFKGMEKTHAIVISEISESGNSNLPRQFAPRSIFGSGTVRYRCVLQGDVFRAGGCTLQLSWQPKRRLSEAFVLRLANEHGIQGVPTLIGSNDMADMDDSSVRSSLQRTFAGLPSIRPVDKVLRAIVWKEDCIPLSSLANIVDFLSASHVILQVIVELNRIGILHTNISEANMMALRAENTQGILVGFEFAMLDSRIPESNKVRTESSRISEDGGTTVKSLREATLAISEQASGDVVTHHVATLPLDRCMDNPPVHQFQHELESFIWSMFFIQIGFRCGRRILNPDLEKWYTGDWNSIRIAKKNFLTTATDCATFAGVFAESLGVNPQPLMTCSQSLIKMLLNSASERLDAALILSTLLEARDAYTRSA